MGDPWHRWLTPRLTSMRRRVPYQARATGMVGVILTLIVLIAAVLIWRWYVR